MTTPAFHEPVLAGPLFELIPRPTRAVDCTLGDGGHSALLLSRGARVLGIDQDPDAIARARTRLGDEGIDYRLANAYDDDTLEAVARFEPDLVLLDLGVSSRQLDLDPKGFSFRPGVPLDMRMGGEGATAAALLNESDQPDLARWLADYGDEPRARKLAAEIVRRRASRPFQVSDDLVNAIRAALGPRSGPGDFARIFQAVPIVVNDELAGLERALPRLRDGLVPGGALAAVSYHSGEDRLVKNAFREWSAACVCPPAHPVCTCRGRPLGRTLTRRPIMASEDEVAANPRARSARLRIFELARDGAEA